MIIVELNGGLGNQMFIYAAGFALAKKNDVQLRVDPSHLTAWHIKKKWDPEVLKLNISNGVCTRSELKKFVFKTGVRYLDIFIRNRGLFENNVYDEKGIFSEKIFDVHNGYLRGFFGDLRYFDSDEMRKVLREEFKLKDKSGIIKILGEISNYISISVHIRRGDLLKLDGAYVLPKNYYVKAINLISKKVENPLFYFFSDDIGWCKENFRNLENCVFIEGNSVVKDFELMKTCKHNILANSTLSWWVGYLNYNKKPIIIAPKHFGTFKNNNGGNLRLEEWIALEN